MDKALISKAYSIRMGEDPEIFSLPKQSEDDENSLVTTKMLQKTKANLQNSEHSSIVRAILKKKATFKSNNEILFLQEAFQEIQFFEKMKNELEKDDLFNLFKKLKLETFEAGKAIFNYGDWGEKFYIIIKGSVYVLLKKHQEIAKEAEATKNHGVSEGSNMKSPQHQKSDEQGQKQEHLHTKDTELESHHKEIHIVPQGSFSEEMSDAEKLEHINSEYPGYFLGRIMETGASFGEIALQNRVRRTATIVCKENTVLGILTQDDYNKLLYKIYKKKDEENLAFIKSFNIFSHLSNSKLNEINFQLQRKSFYKNHVFYREGQPADNIYFIISAVEPAALEDSDEANNASNKRYMFQLFARNSNHLKKRIKYALLPRGHYFGMEELFTKNKRSDAAKVISLTCEVYVISHSVFRRLVTDHELIKIAKQNIEKRAWMVQKISSNVAKINETFSREQKAAANSSPKRKPPGSQTRNIIATLKMIRSDSIPNSSENKQQTPIARTQLFCQIPSQSADVFISKQPTHTSDLRSIRTSLDGHQSVNFAEFSTIKPREVLTSQENKNKHETPKEFACPEINMKQQADIQSALLVRKRPQTAANKSIELKPHQHYSEKSLQDNSSLGKSTLTRTRSAVNVEYSPLLKYAKSHYMEKKPQYNPSIRVRQHSTPLQGFSEAIEATHDNKATKRSKQYRSLCKVLKIDKLFGFEKDRVDLLLSESHTNTPHYSANQDFTFAIKSFKLDQGHDTKLSVGSFLHTNKDNFPQTPVSRGLRSFSSGYGRLTIKSLMKK